MFFQYRTDASYPSLLATDFLPAFHPKNPPAAVPAMVVNAKITHVMMAPVPKSEGAAHWGAGVNSAGSGGLL